MFYRYEGGWKELTTFGKGTWRASVIAVCNT